MPLTVVKTAGIDSGSVTFAKMANNAVHANTITSSAVTYTKEARRWKDVSTNTSVSSTTTISVGDKCLVGTANGVVSITLPITSLSIGDEVEFLDSDGQWSGNNATIHSGSSTILIDSANNFLCDTANTSVRLVYVKANQWKSQVWS
tara:strand:+ start:1478 stop:1918 length:441 start_codon:yes stop_codon:yes gene_type:complete